MNDFDRDNAWQRRMRDEVLAPGFYRRYSTEGCYVFIDKGRLASILQKRYSVDTIVQGRDGGAVCLEEKIVRWPGYQYKDVCLETHSCTNPGHESPGWMEYGRADYLLYCFAQENGDLECYLINFPELQAWFKPCNFPTFGPLNTLNRSMGRKVPIALIQLSVPTWRRYVRRPQTSAPASVGALPTLIGVDCQRTAPTVAEYIHTSSCVGNASVRGPANMPTELSWCTPGLADPGADARGNLPFRPGQMPNGAMATAKGISTAKRE